MSDIMDLEELQESIRKRQGVFPDQVDIGLLREAGCMMYVAPLPDDYGERLHYLGDLLSQMGMNHSVEDPKLHAALRSIATAFSYLINSSSYSDGVLHSYDAGELRRKLRPFLGDSTDDSD